MKPLDRATIAEIAARYNAAVAPDVTAAVVPQGVSAVPLPVWREAGNGLSEGLYDPVGAKSFRARMWSHMPKPKKPRAVKPKVIAPHVAKLLALHDAGMTNAEIAIAIGSNKRRVKDAIIYYGRKANKKTNNGE